MRRIRANAVVAGLAVTGIVLRAWLLTLDVGAFDADEAVPGTMARHLLDGGGISAFYWGQNYGGTHEQILTAGVFALVGENVAALRSVPLLLFATGALLTWRIGVRTVGEPYARLGAGVFWVWSTYVIWKSTRAHGFYGAGLVLGLVAVLLALRLEERPTRRDLALLGLAIGLGFWATPQVIVIALPAVAWLLWRRRDLIRSAWIVLGAAVVGALPWIGANLRHDWYSFHTPPRGGSLADSIHNLLAATLPTALGARVPFTLEWIGGGLLGASLYALFLASIVWSLVRARGRLGPIPPVLIAFPVFYALSPFSWLNAEPRYLVLIGPLLALLVVAAGGTPGRAVAIACSLVALSVIGIVQLDRRNVPSAYSEGLHVPADFKPLLRTLEAHGVRHAFADYWLGWRIVFETDEEIIAVKAQGRLPLEPSTREPRDSGERGRWPPFYFAVLADPDAAYVFLPGSAREARSRAGLLAAGYRRLRTGNFVVYLRR